MKALTVGLAVTTGLLIASIGAQSAPDTAGGGHLVPGNMMPSSMMSQMPQMMRGQMETRELVDQLAKNFAAIEAEKDPAARNAKLQEHGALLKELQTKVETQSHRMEMMQQRMMNDPKAPGDPMKDMNHK